MPGAGVYKVCGGKKPVIATLNSFAGFCATYTAMCSINKCHFSHRVSCLFKLRKVRQWPKVTYEVLLLPYAAIYPLLIRLMKKADKYIALSQTVKDMYVTHGYAENKICVIPNFTEKLSSSPGLRDSRGHYRFNFLYIGRLQEEKGVDILIQAFYKLAKDNPRVQLTIVGDGPQGEALKRLVGGLKIDKQVVFAGEVPHEAVWRYYQTADVFVHPAIWAEPFGRIILEAMQFHLLLIVSNAGAPAEIIGDSGLVFEKGNVDDLAQKLELIYRDEKLRQKLGSNCSNVLQSYKRDKIIDRIVAVYQEVLDRQ